MPELDQIISVLCRENQRATYGAVADLTGEKCYRGMGRTMNRRGHSDCNRWIVKKSDGLPSGYAPDELGPPFPGPNPPIENAEELKSWLVEHVK